MADEETTTVVENTDDAEVATPETTEVENTSTEDVESEATEAETEEAEKPAEKPKKTAEQKKIAKQARNIREMKRENARMMKMIETQTESVSKLTQNKSEAPKIEDFETMDAYLDARDAYTESKRKAPPQEHQTDYNPRDDLSEAGTDKYDDFEEVVFAEDVRISQDMAAAIFEIDDLNLQADVAYFLGQNPKEAAKISRLSDRRQVAEIAKIEMKLSTKAPAAKKASKAPAPIKPVGGTKTSNDGYVEGEDFESFLKKRNKQLGR